VKRYAFGDLIANVDGGAEGGLYYTDLRERGDLIYSDHIHATPYHAFKYVAKPNTWTWESDSQTLHRKWKYPPGFIYSGETKIGTTGFYPEYQFGFDDVDPNSPNFPDWLVKSARSRVLTALVDSDVNIGNFLGELPESLGMILGSSITVLQAFRALRRGQFARIPRILGVNRIKTLPKTAAGVWFAYKFGWKPLIEDIYTMHGAVMEQLNRPTFAKVTRSATTSEFITDPGTYKVSVNRADKGATVGVSYKVGNEFLAKANALGLINPFSIAWELTPLSFVVDWFVPVGSFLQQMSAPLGLDFIAGYETTYSYLDIDVITMEPPEGWSGGNAEVKVKAFGFVRTDLTTWPEPSLVIQPKMDANRLLTLLGLIVQRFT
jgi:hypothetical protein